MRSRGPARQAVIARGMGLVSRFRPPIESRSSVVMAPRVPIVVSVEVLLLLEMDRGVDVMDPEEDQGEEASREAPSPAGGGAAAASVRPAHPARTSFRGGTRAHETSGQDSPAPARQGRQIQDRRSCPSMVPVAVRPPPAQDGSVSSEPKSDMALAPSFETGAR